MPIEGFSVVLTNWTFNYKNTDNKRYLNVNVHCKTEF